jgi:HIT zinc finger
MEKPQSTPRRNNHQQRKRRNTWESRNGNSRRARVAETQPRKAPVVATKPLCSVCQKIEQPKYKCPKCRDTYCSIQCCRDHKAKGCSLLTEKPGSTEVKAETSKYLPQEELTSKVSPPQSRNTTTESVDDDLEPGWRITNDMKEALQNSDWLKNELKDVGLRQIIKSITSAPNVAMRHKTKTKQEAELDKAKSDFPEFNRFIDKLLVMTGILERQGACAEVELEEWLKLEKDLPSSNLIIKGEKGRKPFVKIDPKEDVVESSSDDNDDTSSDGEDSSPSDDDED